MIYMGTFSKKLVPALRIGFMVCPRALRPVLVGIKRTIELGTSLLLQHVLAEFLERGYLRAHLEQDSAGVPDCGATRSSRRLSRILPPGMKWRRPERGLVLWLPLPAGFDSEGVFDEALRRGVLVGPSALYEVEARAGARAQAHILRRAGRPSRARRASSRRGAPRDGQTAAPPARGGGASSGLTRARTIMQKSTFATKVGLATMLKGGVIMDVVNAEQARIAEDAGAAAVMALERVPAQIRREGGVARASDPAMIQAIQASGEHPGDGQVPHRPLHGGAHPRGAGGRLHR